MQSRNGLTRLVARQEEHEDAPSLVARLAHRCIHCGSCFTTAGGLNSHITQRLDCRRFGKQVAEIPPAPPMDLSTFEPFDPSFVPLKFGPTQHPSGSGPSHSLSRGDPGPSSLSTHNTTAANPSSSQASGRPSTRGTSSRASRGNDSRQIITIHREQDASKEGGEKGPFKTHEEHVPFMRILDGRCHVPDIS